MEPSRVHEVTGEFLADHSGSADAVRELLALDERNKTWAFDQTDLDSGLFGELVSRGIVESVGEEYRVTHREAVWSALMDEPFNPVRSDSEPTYSVSVLFESISIDFQAVGGLLAALAVVVMGRAWTYGTVVRRDSLVSPGNDPYFYRYWQAELLERSTGVTDTSVVTSLPSGARSRPYTHVVNWWLTELLGGTQSSADLVAAWLPIVSAVALGVVLYFTVTALTADKRIGVVAVTLLGVMPVHAVYTSLGFLEHRLHQYFWLGVVVFALTWLAKHSEQTGADGEISAHEYLGTPRTWAVAGLLSVAIAVSPYPWAGSTLIFGPVALYLGVRVATDVRQGVSPVLANLPATIAVTVGGVVALYPHLRWGWHESTAFLAFTPLLVAAGTVAVVSFGELWRRLGYRGWTLVSIETLAAAGIVWAFIRIRPDQVAQLQSRINALLFREGATETLSLFTVKLYVVFGPLYQLGILFYLAVVPLVWISWVVVRQHRPEWMVPVVFGWYFLALAAIQVRFAAHLSIFVSIFGAVSIVYILATIDLIREPEILSSGPGSQESAEERSLLSGKSSADEGQSDVSRFRTEPRRVVYTVGIVVLILSLNLGFTPGLIDQSTHSNAEIEAMTEIQSHADSTGREYPETRVLSQWGKSRMYNYFVSGESQYYVFARSNYESFLVSSSPDDQYRQLGGQTGYVVVTDIAAPSNTTQTKLYRDFGAGEKPAAHYQLLYVGDGVRAFALVEGAVIQIENVSANQVRVSTDVQTAGQRFEYSQSTTPNENATAALRVPYPGEYQVGNRTVTVSDSAVRDGRTVSG